MKNHQINKKYFGELIEQYPFLNKWIELVCRRMRLSGIYNFDALDLIGYINYSTRGRLPNEFKTWIQIFLNIRPEKVRDYLSIRYQVLDVPRLDEVNLNELL